MFSFDKFYGPVRFGKTAPHCHPKPEPWKTSGVSWKRSISALRQKYYTRYQICYMIGGRSLTALTDGLDWTPWPTALTDSFDRLTALTERLHRPPWLVALIDWPHWLAALADSLDWQLWRVVRFLAEPSSLGRRVSASADEVLCSTVVFCSSSVHYYWWVWKLFMGQLRQCVFSYFV